MVPITSVSDAPGSGNLVDPIISFESYFSDLSRLAYRCAFRIIGDRSTSADVAQETMIRAYVRWNLLSARHAQEPWVARVATNLAIDAWRKQDMPASFIAHTIASGENSSVSRLDIARALTTLSEKQRTVVILRYFIGLTDPQIAHALRRSLGTVKRALRD